MRAFKFGLGGPAKKHQNQIIGGISAIPEVQPALPPLFQSLDVAHSPFRIALAKARVEHGC